MVFQLAFLRKKALYKFSFHFTMIFSLDPAATNILRSFLYKIPSLTRRMGKIVRLPA